MPHPKINQQRISLVAGIILIVVTLLVGVTVFIVMERHAEELLSKSLQLSLQNRVQLIQTEIEAGVDKAMVVATRPLLIDQVQQVNTGADEDTARMTLNRAVQAFLPTGLTAIAVLDKDGRELARAGAFTQKSALTVPLDLPGRVQLMWDGQLLLHAMVDLKREGRVVGKVMTEVSLPVTTGAFKDASRLAKTGELALCASFGISMQCFPTTLNPKIITLSKRSPKGVPLPMTHALEGQTGFITTRDYRDQEVVAAYAPVDDLGLGMVLKMDSAELYAPVWSQLRYLIPLLLGVLVIALLLLRWLLAPLVLRLVRSEAQAREMSASLRDSERRAQALLDNMDEGIITISDSGIIELINPAAERMFGYRSEDVVGKNVSMLMPEPYRSGYDGYMERYLHTGQAHIFGIGIGREVTGRRSDGDVFPMELRISEFYLEGRRQFIGSMRDITERKKAEVKSRRNEERFRTIFEQAPLGIALIDSLTGRIFEINSTFANIAGRTHEEMATIDWMTITHPDDVQEDLDNMARLNAGEITGFQMDKRYLQTNGSVVWVSMIIAPIQVEDKTHPYHLCMIEDITERKRITEALRASELQLRQITDAVPALIADLDLEQRFRFHNKAYEEVFGLSFGQINGRTLAEVLGPQTYGGVQDKVEEVLRGYPVRYERIQITPQGDIRNYAMQYFPRYGVGTDEGKVIGFFSLGTDITELKRIDRMKTEFVSTVSHELRTPLTSIRGSLGLIAGGVAGELPEGVKNLVGIAKNNCERLIRLINDILDIEKIESGKMRLDLQVVDIKPLVQQALAANEGFAGQQSVTLLLRAPDEPLQVRIDSDRLTQVLTNLLSNAVKFSPPESAVEVRVSRVGQQVRVEVADHGPGIPEEFRSRIFQKFSQADASDARQKGGTGLGLNISKALIEKMGGHIGFSSEAGAGTTFFFEVPEWQNPAPLPPPSRARATSPGPRILICESDPDVAKLISMMLGKAGFEADLALSAAQALACLARNSYDAVTVDLKLPGQHGAAFISALRRDERTRELPVVVISAMAEEGQLQFDHKLLTVSDWLEKPIDENRLILSIRRAVAGVGAGKPRVLHVEDDPDIQLIVGAIVQDSAIFEFAATLNEARALLREHRFDLVLLDLALGEESGWDLFDDIDALDPRPPVIVFSASDVDPADGKQAEAVLVKARTSNTELLNTIQRALQIPGDPGPTRPQPLS